MEKRLVKKFGGTSVGNIARLERVALTIKDSWSTGASVAAVVSAMAGVTNQLVGYVKGLTATTNSAEYDTVVSAGEQVSAGLLAIALEQIGVPARSFLGWQLPIYTTAEHGAAHIQHIDTAEIEACWASGIVPVIAGFQGLSRDNRLTTLGRGGSDTTAVGIASFLNADACDIYTDVEGVYTADPRIVPRAALLPEITYDEMLAFAHYGAKVLHAESVQLARQHNVPVRVLSSFTNASGTRIISGIAAYKALQGHSSLVRGVTHKNDFCRITCHLAPGTIPLHFKKMLETHGANGLEIEVFQNGSSHDTTTIIVSNQYFLSLNTALKRLTPLITHIDQTIDTQLSKLTIIGQNLDESRQTVALQALADAHIPATALRQSSRAILSIMVSTPQSEQAVRVLHTAFHLDHQHIHDNEREKKSCA